MTGFVFFKQQLVKPIAGRVLQAVEINSQKPCLRMQKMITAAAAAELQERGGRN